MGVTIYVKFGINKISMPYSSLQDVRAELLNIALQYLKSSYNLNVNLEKFTEGDYEENEEKDMATKFLLTKTLIIHGKIDYKKLGECEDLFSLVELPGIYKFINHADDEGFHSVGDSFDILESLQKISRLDSELPKRFDYLFNIFRESSEDKKLVKYS